MELLVSISNEIPGVVLLMTELKLCKKCGTECKDGNRHEISVAKKYALEGEYGPEKFIGNFCNTCWSEYENRPWWKKFFGIGELL